MATQWNPTPILGGANWGGNPQVATKQQLLSTSAGLLVDITDWSLYSAVSDVNLNGHSLLNVNGVSSFATNVSSINAIYIQTVWLSTQAMNVSSINQSTIDFFNGTVTIEGNTSITTQGITTNNTTITANGTTGGGGNNPTSGGSGNTTFGMINNAIGAVMDTVSKTQQAISGVLNNTGAVLFQTYYAVETAGAIIDLANGAVSLATNAQAMYDTREQNLIAGPRGNPGQTSYVYETINGTTQFQFSTLGASTYSVFRTTDQQNPNQTFGQEIFTSTIIPAGSKVLRSVSDPYQFPIISTQLLSTTNYLQSFGQWHAILEPEYVLKASTIITANLSTTFANITVLSSAKITASSINITGGLTFSTLAGNPAGQYDISRTFASTTSIFDGISSVTNNILSYTLSNTMTSGGGNTSPKWNLVNPGLTTLDATNESFWSKTLAILTGGQYGYSVWVQLGQANSVNDYIDFKNESSVVGIDIYAYPTIFGGFGSPPATFRIPPGNINIYRFVWTGSTWTYGLAPSESPQTTINQFTINQQSLQTILSTNRALIINSGVTSFNSQTNMLYTEIDDLYVQNILASSFTTTLANISTLSTQTLDASYAQINTLYVCTLFGSTITVNNIIDNITSTTSGVFDTVSVSSIQSINLSTQNIFSQIASLSTTNLSTMTTGNAFITNLSSLNLCNLNLCNLNLCNLNLSSSNAFISTLSNVNFYTTNATVQAIQATSGYFSSLFALSTTTQQASISSIIPYNAFTILNIAAPTNIVGNTNITGNTNIYGSTLVGGVFTLGGVRAIRNFVFSVTQSWAHNALNGSATVKDGAGNTYSASQWVMNTGLMAIAEVFGQNFSSALNYIQTDQHVDGNGNYYISWSIVANVDRSGNNEQIQWNITMIPKEMTQTMAASSYAAGFPSTVNSSTILYEYPNIALSSIHASTLTFQAIENISLLAGNFTIPTYFSTGSITVGGTNQASVLANIVAIGAQTDVDIAGYTGNVNIAAGSNIYLTAASNVNINTFTTIQIPGTGLIQSVSPLALTNGNDYAGTLNKSQIEFQYYDKGGFNHYISSRHNGNVVNDFGNGIDFWLYSYNGAGDAQTASSAPGTGNVISMSITAASVITFRPLYLFSDFNRRLLGTDIAQPIIQYGTETGGGTSGSVTISLPVAYTSATSYVAMVSMEDSTPAKMSVTRDSASQITIYWALAGSDTLTLCWQTSGT
jgi:hypothetical protein